MWTGEFFCSKLASSLWEGWMRGKDQEKMIGNVEVVAMEWFLRECTCEEQGGKWRGSVKESSGRQWGILSQEQQAYALRDPLNMTCALDSHPSWSRKTLRNSELYLGKPFVIFGVDCEGPKIDQEGFVGGSYIMWDGWQYWSRWGRENTPVKILFLRLFGRLIANYLLTWDYKAVEGRVTRILNVLEKGHKRHQLVHQHQKCRQSPQDAS